MTEYTCQICSALTFPNLEAAYNHCVAENKGKRMDSQWRHAIQVKKA